MTAALAKGWAAPTDETRQKAQHRSLVPCASLSLARLIDEQVAHLDSSTIPAISRSFYPFLCLLQRL